MKCPVCVEAGDKSTVRDHGQASTLMANLPFFDEDGLRHHHDSNRKTSAYSCSRGHRFEIVVYKTPCQSCDWGHDSEPEVKVGK
jgi:hypothetical protein